MNLTRGSTNNVNYSSSDGPPSPDSLPLEPNVTVMKQNGGSTVSSADNSRSMAMNFENGGGAAPGLHHAKSNGSMVTTTNGYPEKIPPKTMF